MHGDDEEHRETHKIKSRGFNLWLRLLYYAERNGAPSSEAMSSAVKTITAKAHYDGVQHEVFLRSANLGDRVYVDMCDAKWRAIEIDSAGYRVIDDPPVCFRREPGMLALPTPSAIMPEQGIEKLNEILRLRDDRDFVLIVAWLLAALASKSPFAVAVFLGEPGATKTSAATAVRAIIDPNVSPLRTRPEKAHGFAQLIGVDEVSELERLRELRGDDVVGGFLVEECVKKQQAALCGRNSRARWRLSA
jgi:hypothetical protein